MRRTLSAIFIMAIIPMIGATIGQTADSMQAFTDEVTGMEFIFVKGGCFQMGDTFGDGYNSEYPVHEVCLDDFYIGKYEVTQGQWKKVMGSNPSIFKNCGDNCPVENVSWHDTQQFISKLNTQSNKQYRLPTEAEWEYAARSGGKKEKWAGTSDKSSLKDYAWYNINSENKTHPVGEKKSNDLGIYDMSGGVWEWCSDWYKYESYSGKDFKDNPKGPSSSRFFSPLRVIRGGGWNDAIEYVRTSHRDGGGLSYRGDFLGLRLVAPKSQ
jgi:formylglycine-generating enzyme required for sulfatase activity